LPPVSDQGYEPLSVVNEFKGNALTTLLQANALPDRCVFVQLLAGLRNGLTLILQPFISSMRSAGPGILHVQPY
jgi:hypothetical protein